ncbi:hypothetical protein G7059_03465 [Erysipelothrix sp. HDW6A]|nr:hypothetical protein G7059_03465 [Erysipelothrix sp. HDW6A]
MLKVTLHKGDFVNNGHRAEFKKEVNEKVGDEMVYKIDFMIDKQYKDSKKWQSIFQLHDKPDFTNGETWEKYSENPKAPPFMIDYVDNNLEIRFPSSSVDEIKPIKIDKDRWYTLTVNVLYDFEGFVEVYLDGESITTGKKHYQTIYNDSVNYVKIGLYRDRSIEENGVIYYDNFEIYKVEN